MLSSSAFWQDTPLEKMTKEQWESLCDGCALCCLHKLEDEDTGEVYYTTIVCHLLDCTTCQCSRYPERTTLVPTCVNLTLEKIKSFHWLPTTCAYRLVYEGSELPDWHPLISGNSNSVIQSGSSVLGWYEVKDNEIDEDNFIDYVLLED